MADPNRNQSLNDGFTAQPTTKPNTPKSPPVETAFDYGDMNEDDARASGYTDKSGHAKDMAKPDVPGSPTGAFTDIGAGRSSVVKHKNSERGHS
jgi:hypothetical protein